MSMFLSVLPFLFFLPFSFFLSLFVDSFPSAVSLCTRSISIQSSLVLLFFSEFFCLSFVYLPLLAPRVVFLLSSLFFLSFFKYLHSTVSPFVFLLFLSLQSRV